MKKVQLFVIGLIGIFALASLVSASTSGTITNDYIHNDNAGGAQTASSPAASPTSGTYTASQSVTLSASGASSIRFTTDGSAPSCTSGALYSSPISVGSSQTIKTVACYVESDTSVSPSTVASFPYTITISSGGGGGGGGSPVTYCSAPTYSDWGACVGGFQFRQILSHGSSDCALTTEQQLAAQRACTPSGQGEQPGDTQPESGTGQSSTTPPSNQSESDVDVKTIMQKERDLLKKVNAGLSNRLAGRMLLQVEEKGQAWYVEPSSKEKHFLGRPADAFSLMRRFGLGLSEANFAKFEKSGVPARFAGRIFLRVEANGEAYYINPVDLKMHYLGRPEDAFNLMRELALGISNDNIRQIQVAAE